ncbi:MAG: hypothetical protein PHR35_01825, partial [Kiritimatiellae bacterium]|nr:hypothetical protein [Kiritimatiellia bacterium]
KGESDAGRSAGIMKEAVWSRLTGGVAALGALAAPAKARITVVLGLLLAGGAWGAQLVWDASPGNGQADDGSGTWSTGHANWWNGGADKVWPNASADTAIFGANNGAAGVVTMKTGTGEVWSGLAACVCGRSAQQERGHVSCA